ncbi:hypothetical protein O6H91_Y107200 [Diphasiastrum complanatum]|nr:hypothetical protein O6H91_Y107200 [Diphasiastrum complanatum]
MNHVRTHFKYSRLHESSIRNLFKSTVTCTIALRVVLPKVTADTNFHISFRNIATLCGEERLEDVLQELDIMFQRRQKISCNDLYVLLQSCIKQRNLAVGRRVHALIVKCGLESNTFLGNHLIRLFSSCGSLNEAYQIFCSFSEPDINIWTAIISAYSRHGHIEEALRLYTELQHSILKPNDFIYVAVLKACAISAALARGRIVHLHIKKTGYAKNMFVGGALIDMYTKCKCLVEARQVFDGLTAKDVVLWNAMITGYAQNGCGQQALQLFWEMLKEGIKPNRVTFVSTLRACSLEENMQHCKLIHDQVVKNGFTYDLFVANSLITMYAKGGMLELAEEVFHKLPNRDIVSWNAMITGYIQHGNAGQALQQFEIMQHSGILPDSITFVNVLKACGSISNLEAGKLIHAQIVGSNLGVNVYISSALIDMYAKCGSLEKARLVFDKLSKRNIVSWNAMIGGYAQHSYGEKALQLFHAMHQEGLKPNSSTFVSTLRGCGSIGAIEQGKLIHHQIIENGLELDVCVGSRLVDMYAKCGILDKALEVFEKLPKRDLICWNAIIAGYMQQGLGQQALSLFKRMKQERVSPDAITYVSILKACGSVKALEAGRMIHVDVIKDELESNLFVGSTLVDMYMKCGILDEAQHVFDNLEGKDVVSWNAIIVGYVQNGHGQQALKLFHKMLQDGFKPNDITFFSALKACGNIGDLSQGKLVHDLILKNDMKVDEIGGSLVGMYAKCGSIEEAHKVFISLPRTVILCNAMIAAFAQHGLGQQALQTFKNMQEEDLRPNSVTFANILKACSGLVAIDEGKLIHAQIVKSGLEVDVFVANSLVDMYAKCGSLNKARQVFDKLVGKRDVVSWNTMIAAYAQHGFGQEAIQLFHRMLDEAYKPNDVSFLSVLSACSHASLLDEGFCIFKSMSEKFDVTPRMQHYACMVDLISRNGNLFQAEDFISNMPFEADTSVLMSLLGACRTYGNIEVGRRTFESLVKLDCENASAYVLMSNIYASADRWKEKIEIRKMMIEAGGIILPDAVCDGAGKLGSKSSVECNLLQESY